MIPVTRLDNSTIIINVEKIQSVQANPDTIITFTNNDRIMVKEPLSEVSSRIIDYQRALYQQPLMKSAVFQDLPGGRVH